MNKIILLLFVCVSTTTALKIHKRAAPPKKWDIVTLGTFFPNAFDGLEGSRPDFFASKEEQKQEKQMDDEEAHGDFNRVDLMKKIDVATNSIREIMSSKETFEAGLERIYQPLEVLIMMGNTIFHSDPDFGDEDEFLKQAEEMVLSAKSVKSRCKEKDYKGADEAFSRIKKTCTKCHGEFK